MIRSYPTLQCYIIMLKPRGFVPWGLPGPTRGRRDAAALASKTKGTARMGGRVGVGPTDSTFPLPMQSSGQPWASKRTIVFFPPQSHLLQAPLSPRRTHHPVDPCFRVERSEHSGLKEV